MITFYVTIARHSISMITTTYTSVMTIKSAAKYHWEQQN